MKWNKSNLNCLRVEYAHTEQLDLSILCVALHSIRNIEGVSVSFDREKWNDKLINRKEKKKKTTKNRSLSAGRKRKSIRNNVSLAAVAAVGGYSNYWSESVWQSHRSISLHWNRALLCSANDVCLKRLSLCWINKINK